VRHSRRACALLHQSPQLLSGRLLNVFHGAQLRLDAAFSLAGFLVSTDGRIGVSAEAAHAIPGEWCLAITRSLVAVRSFETMDTG
jgi:hypothetical protein